MATRFGDSLGRAPLGGYQEGLRAMGNGSTVYNGDTSEAFARATGGWTQAFKQGEQRARLAQERFDQDVERAQLRERLDLQNAALRREDELAQATQSERIAHAQAKLRSDRMGYDLDNEQAQMAMETARMAFDERRRKQREADTFRLGMQFGLYEDLFRGGGRASAETLEAYNAQVPEGQPRFASIGITPMGDLVAEMEDGSVKPFRDFGSLAQYGALNPEFKDVISDMLPSQMRQRMAQAQSNALREADMARKAHDAAIAAERTERAKRAEVASKLYDATLRTITNLEKRRDEMLEGDTGREALDKQIDDLNRKADRFSSIMEQAFDLDAVPGAPVPQASDTEADAELRQIGRSVIPGGGFGQATDWREAMQTK